MFPHHFAEVLELVLEADPVFWERLVSVSSDLLSLIEALGDAGSLLTVCFAATAWLQSSLVRWN
jgi:hypothetical protein